MAFVSKQTAVVVVRINTIGQCCFNRLVAIFSHLILYQIPQLA